MQTPTIPSGTVSLDEQEDDIPNLINTENKNFKEMLNGAYLPSSEKVKSKD